MKHQADYAGANLALEQALRIVTRSYGRNSSIYWSTASDWAKFRYERGERVAALSAFEDLLKLLPAPNTYRNASEAIEVAQVLSKYGNCLSIDGQPKRGIEFLLQAGKVTLQSSPHSLDAATLQLEIGNAYEIAGDLESALKISQSALELLNSGKAPTAFQAIAHHRLGSIRMKQGALSEAEFEFRTALNLDTRPDSSVVIYSEADLARLALLRHDNIEALRLTASAMDRLNRAEAFSDVRLSPYVWSIHAQALQANGSLAEATDYASRALHADRQYFSPDSEQISSAEALFHSTTASESKH